MHSKQTHRRLYLPAVCSFPRGSSQWQDKLAHTEASHKHSAVTTYLPPALSRESKEEVNIYVCDSHGSMSIFFPFNMGSPPPLYCYVFYSLQNDRCVFKRQFKNITGNGLNTKLICFRLSGSSVRKCSKGPVYQVLLKKCCQKLSASLKLPVCSLGLWIRPSELKPINKQTIESKNKTPHKLSGYFGKIEQTGIDNGVTFKYSWGTQFDECCENKLHPPIFFHREELGSHSEKKWMSLG